MRAEATTDTTKRFINSWDKTESARLIAELLSLKKETHREPDTYHFQVSNGLLVDPETGKPVLDFIQQGVEYDVAIKLQTWASENDEGCAYWISPEKEGVYPCNKILIHEIAYTGDNEKVLLNTAILFDGKLDNHEKLRENLFTSDETNETLSEIFSWVETFTGKSIKAQEYQKHERKEAEYYASQIQSGVNPQQIVDEMASSGFLGRSSISCPTSQTFSSYTEGRSTVINLSSEAKDEYGSLTFDCHHCNRENKRPYGKLISNCQHCEKDVTC